MGLRINTNLAGLRTTSTLRNSTLALNKSFERLSSGRRINRAGDDAAGLALAEGFHSLSIASNVSQRNAHDGINLVQTAEGALSETVNIIQRLREIAVEAASDTLSGQNRDDLQLEVDQLLEQVDDIANDTEFNGLFPLAAAVNITLQIGPRSTTTVPINFATASTAAALGISGLDVTGADGANARSALDDIDAALATVNAQRSTLGAIQNRLEFAISTLEIQEQNSTASESAIRDADIAVETMGFTRNQILVSAGTAVLAQANVIPQTALQLLGG